jgi:HSP20 family protein
MPIDRSDPFKELVKLRELFYELFGRSFSEQFQDEGMRGILWAPPVDVYQDQANVVVEMEIPGVDRNSVSIEYVGTQLSIKGERKAPYSEGHASVHRLERQHGAFCREIDLPVAIDAKDISASYESGILRVTLPVHSKKHPKKIPIESGS